MDIREETHRAVGRYVATVDGHEAELTFSRLSPETIIIDHIGVPDALRGMGVGQALAVHAAKAARAGGWRIIPLCPFFKAQSLKHPEWKDLIR